MSYINVDKQAELNHLATEGDLYAGKLADHQAAIDAGTGGSGQLSIDLASTAHGKGASKVAIEDPTGLITAVSTEAALVEVKSDRLNFEATFSTADSAAAKVLLTDAQVPTGKKVFVDEIEVLVNGATAWTDTTGAIVSLQDTTGVEFAELAKAQLVGNASLGKRTTGVTLMPAFWVGGTASKGLQILATDASHVLHSFAAGSTMNLRIKAHLG